MRTNKTPYALGLLAGLCILALMLSIPTSCELNADPAPAEYMFRWTAPGDDAMGGGPATGYELYITTDSTQPYELWTRVGGEPVPSEPYAIDSCLATGLWSETTYHAYIISYDDRPAGADPPGPNYSAISNIFTFEIADATAPSAIADLGGHEVPQ
jgi:hypothetical protein